MHLEHEGVEMHPPLAKARHRAEEQVHQHRFAAADRTAQIKPDRRVTAAVLGKAEAGEPAAQAGFRPVVQQGAIEALQPLDRQLLCRVGLQQPPLAQRAVDRHRLRGRRRGCARIGCHHNELTRFAAIDGQVFRG